MLKPKSDQIFTIYSTEAVSTNIIKSNPNPHSDLNPNPDLPNIKQNLTMQVAQVGLNINGMSYTCLPGSTDWLLSLEENWTGMYLIMAYFAHSHAKCSGRTVRWEMKTIS